MSHPNDRDHIAAHTHSSPGSRRRIIVGLAITGLLICAWFYQTTLWRTGDVGKGNNSTQPPLTGSSELPQVELAPAAGATDAPLQDSFPALPPEDLPLAAQLPNLLARAKRGDPVASCRLAIGVVRCTTHQHVGEFTAHVRQADSVNVRDLANQTDARPSAGIDEHCASFDRNSIGNLDDLLEKNKNQLNVHQKVLLALLQPDGTIMSMPREIARGVIGSATTRFVYSQFQADNALNFLQEGAAAHNRLALEGLILVHAPSDIPGFRPGTRVSLPNPRQFLGYSLLLAEVFGADALGPIMSQTVANVLQSMDPKDVAWVQEQARVSAATWKYAMTRETPSSAKPNAVDQGSICDQAR